MYKLANVCLKDKASGNIEDLLTHREKTSFDWGIKIMKGFSHDLKMLEDRDDDVELKSLRNFEEVLKGFQNYDHKVMGKTLGLLKTPENKLHILNNLVGCTGNYFVHNTIQCNKEHEFYQPGHSWDYKRKEKYCIRV